MHCSSGSVSFLSRFDFSKKKTRPPKNTKMPHRGSSFTVPNCASVPAAGFGSADLGYGGHNALGYGLGSGAPAFAVPSVASNPVIGFGSAGLGQGYASGVPSASLGILSGVNPSCINQIPPAEVLVQPPPVVLTLPGPILSATGEPVAVGGNTPCAVSYGGSPVRGILGSNAGALGGGIGGRLGSSFGRTGSLIPLRRSSFSPCN